MGGAAIRTRHVHTHPNSIQSGRILNPSRNNKADKCRAGLGVGKVDF